jgi:hypothetical protein
MRLVGVDDSSGKSTGKVQIQLRYLSCCVELYYLGDMPAN